MASFFKGILILTILVIYSEGCACKPIEVREGRAVLMLLERICGTGTSGTTNTFKSKILLCFVCNGLVPECLASSTTTTEKPSSSSTSVPTSSTTNASTTTTTEQPPAE